MIFERIEHMEERDLVKSDFDKIAKLKDKKWDHNRHYHKYLLKHAPDNIRLSLDIGCGKGEFANLLSQKSDKVIGIDLSDEMIKVANGNNKDKKIDFNIGDIMNFDIGINRYDYIASIATIHHLPMKEFLIKVRESLKEKGILLILDIYKAETILDYLFSVIASPVNSIMLLIMEGRLRPSIEERIAWNEHGKHDHYLTLKQIKSICNDIIPGSNVKRHLFWRYSIVWRKNI